ncbi:MAG: aminotransferase class IV [Thermoguttaceae bacterium]|nr:aminotransferase class IV [Thermoguttaceae bacterium]MDW8036662.1 aminotransferase class IV [Thermoguttaceae bacterium]
MSETSLAYINGRFVPADQLAISVIDAGFVLGATVTEQLRTFGGRLFRLQAHLDRLWRSLETVGIEPGLSQNQLAELATELAAHNHRLLEPGDDLGLGIFITPGPYLGYCGQPVEVRPTVCLHTYPLAFWLWASKYRQGQALWISSVQQVDEACWPAALKCRSRMHYYLADREAAQKDPGSRAVLLDREGFITETSTANIVIYRAEQGLVSPPQERILPGISLEMLFHLAHGLGIPTGFGRLRPEDLTSADEIMITSTPFCVLPITRLQGQPVANGQPGPIYQKLLQAWSKEVGIDIVAQAERFTHRPG